MPTVSLAALRTARPADSVGCAQLIKSLHRAGGRPLRQPDDLELSKVASIAHTKAASPAPAAIPTVVQPGPVDRDQDASALRNHEARADLLASIRAAQCGPGRSLNVRRA